MNTRKESEKLKTVVKKEIRIVKKRQWKILRSLKTTRKKFPTSQNARTNSRMVGKISEQREKI